MAPRGRHEGLWRAATLVLLCALVGVIAGGVLTRLRRAAPSGVRCPSPPVTASLPTPPPTTPPPPRATADLGASPGPRDGGTAPRGVLVTVEVLDPLGQPAAGASVLARRALAPGQTLIQALVPTPGRGADKGPESKPSAPLAIGELGVLSGPLPFPEDVVAGRYTPPGSVLRGSGGPVGASATTGPDGRAQLVGVPAGYVQILASRDGLGAASELVLPAQDETSTGPGGSGAAPGLGAGMRLVLRLGTVGEPSCPPVSATGTDAEAEPVVSSGEGPEVGGQVTDPRGQPVAGARVEVTVGKRRQLALTDSRGGFTVRGLPLGALVVQVQKAGHASLSRSLRADEPRGDLRLTLGPGGGVAGVLRDARLGGLPTGAQLTLESPGDPLAARQAVVLAADGSFRMTGLAPGEVTLRARAPGYAPLQQTVRVSEGPAPDSVTARDLVLALERGASVLGRVINSSGRGASGADDSRAGITVTAEPLEGPSTGRTVARALTDDRGEFELSDLPAGRLRITASGSAGYDSTTVELRPGDRSRATLELR
ncbi:MAG: carboxypeptidase-like regulatory domain-containing protein [Polyangia bacterium]